MGLYIDNNTGTVTHLEPFLTNTTVSIKGGIAADPGPVQPGQSTQFSQGATYQVVTKTQQNTEIVPNNFVGPLAPNQVRGNIQTQSTQNGTNTVSNQTFNQIKNDVQSSQTP